MDLLIRNININDIIIDKCKVDRAKTKVKTTVQEKHDQSIENLICIAVDGRMHKDTLLYKKNVEENGQKTMKKLRDQNTIKLLQRRHHMKVNIWHRVLPKIVATGAVHAERVVDVLHESNSKNTIKAILVDNTNAKTGCEGGMVAILEKKILIFTQLVPLCTIMKYLSEPFSKI